MARIRSIDPGLYTDEAYMTLTIEAPLGCVLLTGLWAEADDQGVFEWKPLTLKARILPAVSADVAALLDTLVGLKLIQQFSADGRAYGAIRSFRRWQRPEKPKNVYPLPVELRSYVHLGDADDPATALRKAKLEETGGCCAYCGAAIPHFSKRVNTMELQHRIPLSRGGSDDPENLIASCRQCNRAKGDMTEQEFRAATAAREDTSACDKPATTCDSRPPIGDSHATPRESHATARDKTANRRQPTQMKEERGKYVVAVTVARADRAVG